jgi:hypothetical protein
MAETPDVFAVGGRIGRRSKRGGGTQEPAPRKWTGRQELTDEDGKAAPGRYVPKSHKVTLEITVVPAEGNDSDFWDIHATDNLVSWEVARKLLGHEHDGWGVEQVRVHECTLKSVRGE